MEMDDGPAEPGAEVESGHTTDRMSARSQRIEVITRGERRTTLVCRAEAGDCGGESGAWHIADHGGAPLWHQQWPALHVAATSAGRIARDRVRPGTKFARVEVLAMPAQPVPATPSLPRPVPAPNSLNHPEGTIEIALPGGVSVRVDTQVDSGALRRVLAALVRR